MAPGVACKEPPVPISIVARSAVKVVIIKSSVALVVGGLVIGENWMKIFEGHKYLS